MIRRVLSGYIGVCAALVLIVQGLSLVHAITLWPLVICVGAIGLATLVSFKSCTELPLPRVPPLSRVSHPLVLPFALVLPVVVIMSAALGWHVPPNNWDSMTYHLSRAAYWRQWHTLAHFPTNNQRQDAFPGNAEVLLLVTLLVVHSAKLAFLVQFTAYLAATLAVYALGRQIGLPSVYALIGAGAFATMPEVVLQSTSAQNDLTVAAFMVCAVYFFVDAVRERGVSSITLAGVALGLAAGTKPTAVLALPGLGIGALALLWSHRHGLRPTRSGVIAATAAIIALVLLGGPWYIANRAYYGNISGPQEVAQIQEASHPSAKTFGIIFLRYMVAFIDPEGPALLNPATAALACSRTAELRARLATAAHIPKVEPQIEWPGAGYSTAPACAFQEDLSWFGLVGWLAIIAALTWAVGGLLVRRTWSTAWLLAAGATSFLVCASLLLRWSPWQGRLLITAIVLASPLLGFAARELFRHRVGRPILHLIVLYAAATGLAAAFNNAAKPVAAWGASADTLQVMTRPEMGPVLRAVANTVPANARMGVFLNGDDWDFPLFGPHLDRCIQPLVLLEAAGKHVTGAIKLDYVLTHQMGFAVASLLKDQHMAHCRPAWSIDRTNSAAPWRLYRCTIRTGR